MLATRRAYYTPAVKAQQAAKQRVRRDARIAEGVCVACGQTAPIEGLRRCESCYGKHYGIITRRRQRARDAVFARYGGYVCACCGETEPLFLSIDHINGGGNQERKALGRDQYVELARGPVRADLRVLCHNCNRGRWLNGGTCPHEAQRQS